MDEELTRLGLLDDEEIVLDEAALSLALLDNPGVDLTSYNDLLEAVATRLDNSEHQADAAREHASRLARVLGDEFGFVGDTDTYNDPSNADMIRVIDRRRGLPISLSILYVAAARRLGWTANVLNVPGHVLVGMGREAAAIIIDPFRGGSSVSRDQLAAMLATTSTAPRAEVHRVSAMSNRAILVRLLLNQATRAEQGGEGSRALELYRRMTVIAPAYAHPWWARARLELVNGDVAAARHSLAAMLEMTRDPELRRRVVETLETLGTP